MILSEDNLEKLLSTGLPRWKHSYHKSTNAEWLGI